MQPRTMRGPMAVLAPAPSAHASAEPQGGKPRHAVVHRRKWFLWITCTLTGVIGALLFHFVFK